MSTFCWPLYVSCQSQLHLFVIPLYSGHWTRMLTYQLSLLQVLLFHGFWTVFSTEVQGSNSQFSRTAVFEPELVSYKNCPSTMGLFQQCIYKWKHKCHHFVSSEMNAVSNTVSLPTLQRSKSTPNWTHILHIMWFQIWKPLGDIRYGRNSSLNKSLQVDAKTAPACSLK